MPELDPTLGHDYVSDAAGTTDWTAYTWTGGYRTIYVGCPTAEIRVSTQENTGAYVGDEENFITVPAGGQVGIPVRFAEPSISAITSLYVSNAGGGAADYTQFEFSNERLRGV